MDIDNNKIEQFLENAPAGILADIIYDLIKAGETDFDDIFYITMTDEHIDDLVKVNSMSEALNIISNSYSLDGEDNFDFDADYVSFTGDALVSASTATVEALWHDYAEDLVNSIIKYPELLKKYELV